VQLSFGNDPLLYVAGYQGRDLDAFVRLVNKHGIVQVIDVREKPTSRRPGFAKTSLTAALGDAGVAYVHVPEADNPSRHDDAAFDERLRRYNAYLDANPAVIERVRGLVRGKTSLLLAFDRDPSVSHRSVLAARIARAEGLRVVAI
jgi:uncharacterized protein (DUF488 family)